MSGDIIYPLELWCRRGYSVICWGLMVWAGYLFFQGEVTDGVLMVSAAVTWDIKARARLFTYLWRRNGCVSREDV